jgi:DNA-directed RNA polymerase subunit RPC12/RpoP
MFSPTEARMSAKSALDTMRSIISQSPSEVCSRYNAIHHFTIATTYHGNSFNVLEALKWAHLQNVSLAHIVEDDAIVTPDFFQWSRAALESRPTLFAACGWRYSPDALPPADGPDIIIPWYLSVCASLPRRSLVAILQHAKPEYYADMKGYLDAAYPGSHRKGSMHYEQDGLCLRVCESMSQSCAWPRRPRATHVGWKGYHQPQGKEIPGTLDERIAVVRLLIKNPDLLQSMMSGSAPPDIAYCEDCQKPLLTANKKALIRCADCFHKTSNVPRVSSHYYFPKINLPADGAGVLSEMGV